MIKKKVKKSKYDMLKYTFENILMRLGMEACESDYETYVILDWPPEGNPQPFIRAFYRLYHTGLSSAGNEIFCGKLEDNNFFHSLLFAKCNHSPLLQFSDLIIGSFKDFIEAKLFEKDNNLPAEIFELYKSKIRSLNGKLINYGILASSGNYGLKDKMKTFINETE